MGGLESEGLYVTYDYCVHSTAWLRSAHFRLPPCGRALCWHRFLLSAPAQVLLWLDGLVQMLAVAGLP